MRHAIDVDECLRDSPKFREQLETEEASIDALELKLEKVLKTCSAMIESGKIYVASRMTFANALWDLSSHFSEDEKVSEALNRITHAIQEMNKYHSILLDQASRTIMKNLNTFVKVDIKKAKEYKHHFQKISNDLDLALNRNSQVSRNKPADIEEAVNLLSATRTCFRHTALDYVHAVTVLQACKRHETLATCLSYIQACSTYFHQGADLSEDLEPNFRTISDDIAEMRTETKNLVKVMEDRHTVVNDCDATLPSCQKYKETENKDGTIIISPLHATRNTPRMEGYLFKRTSNAFKTWNRRYFYLYDNRLVYRKRTGELNVTIMEDDLRVCTVKTTSDCDRRFCFEVVSPSKSHILQADSEEIMTQWIGTIQHAIRSAIQQGMHRHKENKQLRNVGNKHRVWEQILSMAGNNHCCDCSSPNPKWASINLGITLCIQCSGVHRSLGVHYSKVRSLTLDDWEPDIIKVMAELGNKFVNRIYEAEVENSDIERATPNCDNSVREKWIRAKYVDRAFVHKNQFDLSASDKTRWSVRRVRRRRKKESEPSKNGKCNSPLMSSILVTVSQNPEFKSLLESLLKNPPKSSKYRKAAIETRESVSEKTDSESGSVIIIGKDLEPEERSIELDDSTDGDDSDLEAEDLSSLCPDAVLHRAASVHNLRVMCCAMAMGASCDSVRGDDQRTPLHKAAGSGSVMACLYLLLNGSNLNAQDAEGKTPLHLATERGHTAQVCLFLINRADQSIEDKQGRTPLDIAVSNAHADTVTLLRLKKLNEETNDCEMASHDPTYAEVVRDYTHLANMHPERLLRNNINSDPDSESK